MCAVDAELVAGKADPGVALVTGASRGIGRATAKALKAAGFRVFGTSRRTVSEIPDGITMLIGDVTDDASVAKLVDEVLANAGHIDLGRLKPATTSRTGVSDESRRI
jgi:NAD(P)-dependent dehydrogenase (short-subunit alcohol dehydrogenase family)